MMYAAGSLQKRVYYFAYVNLVGFFHTIRSSLNAQLITILTTEVNSGKAI